MHNSHTGPPHGFKFCFPSPGVIVGFLCFTRIFHPHRDGFLAWGGSVDHLGLIIRGIVGALASRRGSIAWTSRVLGIPFWAFRLYAYSALCFFSSEAGMHPGGEFIPIFYVFYARSFRFRWHPLPAWPGFSVPTPTWSRIGCISSALA